VEVSALLLLLGVTVAYATGPEPWQKGQQLMKKSSDKVNTKTRWDSVMMLFRRLSFQREDKVANCPIVVIHTTTATAVKCVTVVGSQL
jgi:hypothetical protein